MTYFPFLAIQILVGLTFWWCVDDDVSIWLACASGFVWPFGLAVLLIAAMEGVFVWNAPRKRRMAKIDADYLDTVRMIQS